MVYTGLATSGTDSVKLLVIGSGGREHAPAWKLAQIRACKIYVAPGNAGARAGRGECSITDIAKLAEFARENSVQLTVVGPEVALAAGAVDLFHARAKKTRWPAPWR